MKTVLHTIGSLDSDKGGPSRTVPRLCAELRTDGRWAPRLVCTDPPGATLPLAEAQGLGALTTGGGAGFWRSLGRTLGASSPEQILIHDHGLWLACNAMASLQALRHAVPLVISPRGMLQAEAFDHRSWKKRLAMAGYQGMLLRRASAFHATSAAEVDSLRRLGLRQPVLLLPNAVDLPTLAATDVSAGGSRRALFLSRIHPHKGVLELLQAWAELRPKGWQLVLAGPGDSAFRAQVAERVQAMPQGVQVSLRDAVDDADKWALYASSQLMLLPSRSENFGVVVAEALASAVPVITTTGTPWSDLEPRRCGWYVSPDVAALRQALAAATSADPSALAAMGARGRAWMQDQFSWHGVGRRLADAYDWLAQGGRQRPAPAGMILD